MNLFLGVLAIFINLNTAHADILFLDLNNSPKEIEAAQKAAKQRGEKLIIFPDGSPNKMSHSDLRKKLTEKLDELKANNQQTKISSMILSGHNGNGHFAGTSGSISYAGLQKVLESHPELNDSVKSLYLWGCYTSTPGSIINNWKPTFKNLDVIIGYDGVAPANDKLAGHIYLTDALIKEKRMTSAKTDKELKSIFNNLAHVKNVHASMCKGDTYVSNKKMASLQKMIEQCNQTEAAKWAEVYECYMYGRQPISPDNQDLDCSDVPSNTSNSKLRDMYNHLQDTAHCDDMIRSFGGRNRDQVIRLIFNKNVLKNYFENNKTCVNEVNSFLKDSGSLNQIDMQNWPKLKRSEILRQTSEINEEIYGFRNKELILSKEKNLDLSTSGLDKKTNKLTASSCIGQISEVNGASEYRIPFSWVENSSKEKSRFPDASEIKKETEKNSIRDITRNYANSKARESNLSGLIEEQDLKKLLELQNEYVNAKNHDDALAAKHENYKQELKNKYKNKTDEVISQIKNEIPADADPRLKNSIEEQLKITTFGTALNTAQAKYELMYVLNQQRISPRPYGASGDAQIDDAAHDEADRQEQLRLERGMDRD